ncbi:hypothetical protein [Pararhodobacter marinus]|uniref:hypothetical protein n=1 Tax=Pararhodobacter marinus TaxID=2184063 RepID=UPI00351358EC
MRARSQHPTRFLPGRILCPEARMMPSRQLLCAAALALSLGSAGAMAQSLADSAARIEQLIESGQGAEAVEAARQFLQQVAERTGFGVANAQLTVGVAEGFGMFEPRADNRFLVDEPIHAYVEVYGFSLSPLSNGANRLLFDVSFTLDSPEGEQLTDGMISMGEVQLDSYREPIDGYFHLTYRVTGAVGAYILRTRVVDRASGETAEFSLPVVFSEPGAATSEK